MAEIDVHVGGRVYKVVCASGEEAEVQQLGSVMADKVSQLMSAGVRASDAQLMLLAGIMLAEDLRVLQSRLDNALAEQESLKAQVADIKREDGRADEKLDDEHLERLLHRVQELAQTVDVLAQTVSKA